MQVFGLPGHFIRNGPGASRLLAAQTQISKPPAATTRWRKATAQGLTEQAAKAVGVLVPPSIAGKSAPNR